ncbi:hypothetical protein [Microbacterium rhizomatis]|uniref:Sulfatase n=1 Tax=Microbacterium rhizomatis TaxID=1631477 RepID=A0A5J5IZX1_9MICO|nr:hypothetical protein [Microbacterium rhizomatis]KAA9107805.1 hypothetical protein F6B43_10225 [Microbacterium rhizomatis]
MATVVALAVLVIVPLLPDALGALPAGAIVGFPGESIAVVLLLLVVPSMIARRIIAGAFGAIVVLAILVAALDLGFESNVNRPFNPVDDWSGVISGAGVVGDATGVGGLILIVIAIVVVAVGVAYALARAALRVARVICRCGRDGSIAATVVTATWVVCAVLGAQVVPAVPGIPVAASPITRTLENVTSQTAASIREDAQFRAALGSDPAVSIPSGDLLSALAGKDVVVAFIESYGRTAVQGTPFSAGVDRVLQAGGAQLAADGYSSRSAFLTSSTFGGISWLAHSTLQSGTWVDSQQKYDTLTSSDRLTLTRAFGQAGWRTVAVVPSNEEDWSVGHSFYGYDSISDSRNMGYAGPSFSYAHMPDQYTWQRFYDQELAHPHAPVMAEIDFVSSHTPWTPLPSLVPWPEVGDGSVFDPQPAEGLSPAQAWTDPQTVQRLYGQSVEYSLSALISFLHTYPQPNLVLVVLGDHQPARIVSGADAGYDVPITIIAQDPKVVGLTDSWQWEDGMLPSPDAPVWRMDRFRDRFLDAFSGARSP